MNNAYHEIGELGLVQIPSFEDYLPPTNPVSIYLHDCSPDEIRDIIMELQNGKSSDVPIHVIKMASPVIRSVICALYNRCIKMGSPI